VVVARRRSPWVHGRRSLQRHAAAAAKRPVAAEALVRRHRAKGPVVAAPSSLDLPDLVEQELRQALELFLVGLGRHRPPLAVEERLDLAGLLGEVAAQCWEEGW